MSKIPDKEEIVVQANVVCESEEIYDILKNPMIRTASDLGKSIPLLGSKVALADNTALSWAEKRVESNRNKLVEMIKDCKPDITFDDINNADFILDYVKLQEVVERLRSNEKIAFLARLFCKFHFDIKEDVDLEEYDELLRRINEISMREIHLLKLLYDHKRTNEDFYQKVYEELKIDKDMANSMLSSLTKTGFCKERTGAILDYTGDSYYTTVLLERFLEVLEI